MDHTRLIKDFRELTSCGSDEQAKFFLESHNWDLEGAASAYFDEAMADEPAAPAPAVGPRIPYSGSASFEPQAPAPPAPARAPAPAPAPAGRPAASSAPRAPPAAKPRFATLSDMKKAQEDSGSDGEGPQDYFAGTGGDTGVALHDPNDPRLKKKAEKSEQKDVTDRIFDIARKGGAPPPPPTDPNARQAFGGSGFRLGTTMDPKESAEAQLAAARAAGRAPEAAKKKKSTRILTFYSNGFTVDEGPLRRFDDPANRSFLSDIEQGFAPRELEEEAGGEPVSINLVDKKGEEYKPPPGPKYTAFAGAGRALGSSSSAPSEPAAHATPASSTATPPGTMPAGTMGQSLQLEVDPSKPTTTLQIRLHDGTRLVVKMNLTHTVQHIRSFCEAALSMKGKAYDLMTTFPNKVLSDPNASIQDAGLAGASIVQKLK